MRRQSELDDIYGVKKIRSNPLDPDNDTAETGFRHSDAYHRYFRGYTEIRVPKENGRFAIARYYTQPWIVDTAPKGAYVRKRVLIALLLVLSWAAYVLGMCLPAGSNYWWVAAIPGLAAVILLVIFSAVTAVYLFAPRKMTLWQRESTGKRLGRMALSTGGCMALAVIAKLVHLCLYRGDAAAEAFSACITAAAAAASVGIYILERRNVYSTVPNETVLPEGETHEIW